MDKGTRQKALMITTKVIETYLLINNVISDKKISMFITIIFIHQFTKKMIISLLQNLV